VVFQHSLLLVPDRGYCNSYQYSALLLGLHQLSKNFFLVNYQTSFTYKFISDKWCTVYKIKLLPTVSM